MYFYVLYKQTNSVLMACKKMSRPFKVDDNNNYAFNLLAAGEIMPAFMAKKDHKYVDPIRAEWYKNGNYMSWDDVEKRVPGFKRQMLTKRNKCSFSFVRFSLSMRCMTGMEQFEVKPIKQQKSGLKSAPTFGNDLNFGQKKSGKKFSFRCMSESKFLDMMQYSDPRTTQNIQMRSDKIVMITAYSDEAMTQHRGHGTGCLFDNQHVLTAAHLFKYENDVMKTGLKFVVKRYDGKVLGVVKNVSWPKSFSMTDMANQWQTNIANDLAICTLKKPVSARLVNGIYPVFGVPLEAMTKRRQRITIDGYPEIMKQSGPMNGRNPKTGKEVFNLYGAHGPITYSGINHNSLQTECFFSHGNSGGPAFLCDRKGRYQTTNTGRPVLIGVVVNLGGAKVGDSTVCTPMTPANLAFISGAAGHSVDCNNQFTRDQLLKAQKQKRSKVESAGGDLEDDDEDIEMLCERVEELTSADAEFLKFQDIRGLVKEYPDELGHIKLAGKGRNKEVVLGDLKQWANAMKQ